MQPALTSTQFDHWPVRRGKVRDVYDLSPLSFDDDDQGARLLFITTDRISAFDWVLPNGIPDKGRVLTQISKYWFELLGEPNHLISTDPADFGLPGDIDPATLAGRSMLVRKTAVVPVECVVRGYLSGSGWREYQQRGTVCGIGLPSGLRESDRLPEPIFTPASKEETGHDINITFEQLVGQVGQSIAGELRSRSVALYRLGAEYAAGRGIIVADTKFEWGELDGELILIDEVLTPDSSRFWPADRYRTGGPQPSFDKQFVRDWLESTAWDKNSPPPELPDHVVRQTRAKYIEAFELLTGQSFAWK